MPNQYSYPYFASKENQTLYIIIPTPNPMIFNQVDGNLSKIETCYTEEEILPDFRCKICSATIFNYSDFKIHLQDHQKAVEEMLKTSFLVNDRIQGWKNENIISKSDPSDNIENGAIVGNSNCGSNLDTTKKSENLMPKNEALLSKIVSNPLLEGYKRQLSSNKLFDTSNSPITPLNNFKVSKCSKSGVALEIQNQKFDTELKRKNVLNFPLIKTVDKFGGCMPTDKLSNDMYEILSSAKDSFEKSVSDVEIINSPLINQLHLFKQPVPTCDKNINMPVTKPDSAFSSFQSQLVKPNTMTSTELEDIYLHRSVTDSSSEKRIDQSIDKFNDSVFKTQMAGECNSDISTYSKNKMTTEDNVREKAMGCAKRITSSCPLKSTDGMSILQPLTNTEEKSIRCLHCGKMFESHFSMTKHLIELQETKILYCVLCKSSFTCISSLRKHLLMFHCDAKDRRQCSHCDYRCFQTSDLQKHIARRHTRDFKYKCLYCIKGFATPKELRNHWARNHL